MMAAKGRSQDVYRRPRNGFQLIVACILIVSQEYPVTINALGHDYCLTENFEAKCNDSQVILLTHAFFGRMKLGTCIKRDLGGLGCKRDVIEKMDTRCSGRHSCSVSISDPMLVRTQPCSADLSSYLEAIYECISVTPTPIKTCSNAHHIELTDRTGYIASITTEETACGSNQSPWVIVAQPGQRINITLFDFYVHTANSSASLNDMNGGGHSRPIYSPFCQQYARFEESETKRNTVVCGGDRRIKHVYTSLGHRVKVNIINKRLLGPSLYFMFYYEVVGCPSIKVPADAHLRRDGQTLHVVCNKTTESFRLKCIGNMWEGELSNCSSVPSIHAEVINNGVGLPPVGISVVIIVGVALVVVVYVAIMIICVMYLQRRKRRLRQAAAAEKMDSSELQMGDLQLLKAADSTEVLEERVPMLAKPINLRPALGCVTVGDYPDMHQIRTVLQPRPVDHYSTGPMVGGAREMPCDCMSTYGRLRPVAPPTKPKESIYDHNGRLHKVQCPTVPNGVKPYCELDPKGLTSGSKLPNPDVVTNANKDSKKPGPSEKRRSGEQGCTSNTVDTENTTNRIREASL